MASLTFPYSYVVLLIVLLFLSSLFTATSSKCGGSSVNLTSSLNSKDSTTAWNSPSGHFAFGFQSVLYDNKEFMSVLAVWFAKDPNKTMVWYAKPEKEKTHLFPLGSTVNLTNKGIVVYDPKGHDMLWQRPENNTDSLVSCAFVLDNGSFELVDEDGKKVWESFEEPTDTILPGLGLEASEHANLIRVLMMGILNSVGRVIAIWFFTILQNQATMILKALSLQHTTLTGPLELSELIHSFSLMSPDTCT